MDATARRVNPGGGHLAGGAPRRRVELGETVNFGRGFAELIPPRWPGL